MTDLRERAETLVAHSELLTRTSSPTCLIQELAKLVEDLINAQEGEG